jgi:hypothetical protein
MQPHIPYLGPTADEIYQRVNIQGYRPYSKFEDKDVEQSTNRNWLDAVNEGLVSWEEACQAYTETLNIVLDSVEELLEEIDGKSVISSDHGQMLGERITPITSKKIGHHQNVYTKEALFVPWLEVENGSRREIIEEDPIGFDRIDDEIINEQLKALGYKT